MYVYMHHKYTSSSVKLVPQQTHACNLERQLVPIL